jgi:hypothetical protein
MILQIGTRQLLLTTPALSSLPARRQFLCVSTFNVSTLSRPELSTLFHLRERESSLRAQSVKSLQRATNEPARVIAGACDAREIT